VEDMAKEEAEKVFRTLAGVASTCVLNDTRYSIY